MKTMSSFFVNGLGGKKMLDGVLPVNGAKNSALKAQVASVVFKDGITLKNVPHIEDVIKMNNLLSDIGVDVKKTGKRSYKMKASKELKTDIDKKLATTLRASIVLAGPVLAREGRVNFPHPGGCVIGERPIDVFLNAFTKMGAKIKTSAQGYNLTANHLHGAEIFLKNPSVTGTESLMMTAVLAKGKTVLYNCACEPEIVRLAGFLNKGGAKIKGAGTHTIEITGTGLLKSGTFDVPSDRIEAGSFLVLSSLCGKNVKITKCNLSDMRAVIYNLEKMGVKIKKGKDWVVVKSPKTIKPVAIKTCEYPGFPTDLQAPFSVLLTQACGRSFIFETIFEGRLNYLSDIERMGANVVLCDPHRAIINGPTQLRGREMESPDLRAGLAFLIAGLTANGKSVISNVENIDRGYEKIEERLNAVGAEIKRF